MAIQRMDHVGIVVEDLPAAIEFFAELGLELSGETEIDGDWVGRIIGLEDVHTSVAMMQTPDGNSRLELVKFHSPASEHGSEDGPANARGIRHITFAVEDLDDVLARLQPHGGELVGEVENYRDIYRLCYIRGPEGIILELAERVG